MRGKQSFLSCLVSFIFLSGKTNSCALWKRWQCFLGWASTPKCHGLLNYLPLHNNENLSTFCWQCPFSEKHDYYDITSWKKGMGTKPLYTYQRNAFTLVLPLGSNQCFPLDHYFFCSNLIMAVFAGLFGKELKWRGKSLIFHPIPILYFCIVDVCLHAWCVTDWFTSEHRSMFTAEVSQCWECSLLPGWVAPNACTCQHFCTNCF